MAALCSSFVGNVQGLRVQVPQNVAGNAARKAVTPVAVAVEPPRTWGQPPKGFPNGKPEKTVGVKPVDSRLALKKLESRLRTAASKATERIMHLEPAAMESGKPFFTQHRSRMASWWRDHLAIRAEATECATDFCMVTDKTAEEEVEEDEEILGVRPSLAGKSREAELDRGRAAMREFYYPRSNPQPFA